MPDFLESEAVRWVVGTLVTLGVGLGAIFVPYFLTRERKNLWYENFTYPEVEERVDERIEVTFDGDIVPNVYRRLWSRPRRL
jgi:hypothetical protein